MANLLTHRNHSMWPLFPQSKMALAPALIFLAAPAAAHGDYAWINDGRYKAADGTHCCGWNDCRELKPSEIREGDAEHATPFGSVPNKAVYQSRDGKAWICRWDRPPHKRCLFTPGGG